MAWIATAVVGGSVISGVMSSRAQKSAASQAAGAQTEASQSSIEEQRRQFDAVQELLRPYVQSGEQAIGGQKALLGLAGASEQQQAIAALEGGPQFAALMQQGENAILQNASATGGLRGGNTQAALAQFRPALLSQMIEQQYGRLGQMTGIGQASAAGQAAAAQQTGANVSSALTQQGQALAGQALARGQANAQAWGGAANAVASAATLKAMGVF
jgi:hypothetical protein